MIDPKFKDVQDGDRIFTIEAGWTKAERDSDGPYPIAHGDNSYTVDGFINSTDECPSAWTYNPFDKKDKPPCEFKEGEVIAVRECLCDTWKVRVFYGMDEMRSCCYSAGYVEASECVNHCYRYARKLTPTERGEVE